MCTLKQVLEYYNDLKYWYEFGYGNAINGKTSCPLMKDVKKTFEETKNLGTFYFSHEEGLLPFLDLVGLYKDNFTLTYDIYGEDMVTNRKYQGSRIGPFAQNIGFVFFDCGEGNNSKVLTLHQERVVKLDKCSEEACDWEEFKEAYQVKIFPFGY